MAGFGLLYEDRRAGAVVSSWVPVPLVELPKHMMLVGFVLIKAQE